jgi:transcriptional regulator with XRE-family HTH domain
MPRKPDAANLDNPIRKLRQQFEVTQDRLGELLGMNGDAIRNLENSRMKLTGRILHRLIFAVGAEYSSKRKVWLLPLSRTRCSPRTLLAWRQALEPDEELKRNDHKCLCYRIGALLASAKPRQYHMLFTKICEFLEDCLQEHPSPEATEAFKKSAPKMRTVRTLGVPAPGEKEEQLSLAEERRLPTLVLPHPVILKVTRDYQEFPTPKESEQPERGAGLTSTPDERISSSFEQKPRSSKRRPRAA